MEDASELDSKQTTGSPSIVKDQIPRNELDSASKVLRVPEDSTNLRNFMKSMEREREF
jgi:hypothetical protein